MEIKNFKDLQHLTVKDMDGFWHRVNGKIKEYKFTQEQVAAAISCNYQTFRSWSHYKKYPDITYIFTLAQVLNTTINYLLYGTDIEPSTQPAYIVGKHLIAIMDILFKMEGSD